MCGETDLDLNNFGENLISVHEVVDEAGEACLVTTAAFGGTQGGKQVTRINGDSQRSGKHCYFSGY